MVKSKFSVIVCDPPWSFKDSLSMSSTKRGAKANYKGVLNQSEIKSLPVQQLADPAGCVLALWVPSSLLQEGLDVMKAWGFKQTQTYIWVKTKKYPLKQYSKDVFKLNQLSKITIKTALRNLVDYVKNIQLSEQMLAFYMGRLFRQTHEICLIGINNSKIYKLLKNKSQRSVSFAQNLKHSAKPDLLQDSLELMFPHGDKLEMFGRRLKTGWLVLGNESPSSYGEDIRDSLNKLI